MAPQPMTPSVRPSKARGVLSHQQNSGQAVQAPWRMRPVEKAVCRVISRRNPNTLSVTDPVAYPGTLHTGIFRARAAFTSTTS